MPNWAVCLCLTLPSFAGGLRAQNLVANPSFEIGTQVSSPNGSYSQLIPGSSFAPAAGKLSEWSATSTGTNTAAGSYSPTLGPPNWNNPFHGRWDGSSIGYLQVDGTGSVTMTQTLTATLQNDTAYELTFDLGKRTLFNQIYIRAAVSAGSAELGSTTYSNFSYSQSFWSTFASIPGSIPLRFHTGSNDPNAGAPLKISFSTTNTNPGITEAFFDRVVLTTDLAPSALPTIKQGGVVPVFSSSNTIQPGSWISIYGNNFVGQPVLWRNDFPTALGGVSVKINGKPAYIWYASRTQINVQAPADTSTGAASVTVTTPLGTASGAVTLGPYGPSFSLLDGTHAAAIVVTPDKPGNSGGGYDIIGPSGSSLGYPTRPVKPGETLVLYGVGFGPTTPSVPSGLPFYGAANCVDPPRISIGGVLAKVNFAGVVSAGLYQFNIVVPTTNSGDQPLQAIAGGMLTPPIAVVTVQ